MPALHERDPILLPSPVRLERLPGRCPGGGPAMVADPALPAQGYRLDLLPSGVRIAHRDLAGLRHALATLAQLRVQYDDRLPCLAIEDAPAFAVRGVMLDISRCRVPTMPELVALIDQLASWKVNHLQLYVEHTVAYRDHPLAWQGWDPLTPDEIRTLAAHAATRGIDLAANQNCLGHLEAWFEHPRYAALAEIAPGQPWDFGGIVTKTGPFSLCPSDPGAFPLVEGLLDELLPLFTAGDANIGCDEAYDLGQGRSRERVAREGRAAVYMDWVRRVCAVVRRHGKRPQFWADIALEHPEALDALPEDLLSLCWGYEADAPFARWVGQVRDRDRQAWVCPGTSCWRGWTGRTIERRANLMAAATQGLAAGAGGWLATAWGDLGHRQPWPVTLHALAEACHRAWSGTAAFNPHASSLHALGDRNLGLGPWLDAFGEADADLRLIAGKGGGRLRNGTALFADWQRAWAEPGPGAGADWEACAERLDALGETMPVGPAQITDELVHAGRFARLAAERAWLRRHAPGDRTARGILAEELRVLIAERPILWLARARRGGLERSLDFDRAVLRDMENA